VAERTTCWGGVLSPAVAKSLTKLERLGVSDDAADAVYRWVCMRPRPYCSEECVIACPCEVRLTLP
jgi:hypothetical protein